MSSPPLTPDELSSLVAQAQDGDTDAFGKVYDTFLTPIYRYVVFRYPEDLAEDLVADVFVKAWEKLHTYRLRSGVPFSAWLFKIARHTIIDAYRATRGFDELSEDVVDQNRENDPVTRTERSISVQMVRQALRQIPKDYRDVILLHYVAGLGHREIAAALSMTEGYVRILKFRGLKKLEQLLPSEQQPMGNPRYRSVPLTNPPSPLPNL